MEALITQFTFFSNQALEDKAFDPSTIEDLMKLFEIEAYKSWASMELDQENASQEAETALEQAEEYLDSVMDSAMEEFTRFFEEMEREAEAELEDLERKGESARKMGEVTEKAASIASKRYIEAAVSAAAASMRSAWKGIYKSKVHPS